MNMRVPAVKALNCAACNARVMVSFRAKRVLCGECYRFGYGPWFKRRGRK